MKKTVPLKKEDQIKVDEFAQLKVDEFAQLMAKKRQANQKIDDLQSEIDEMRGRIKTINEGLETLIGVRTEDNRQEEHQELLANPDIPASGIARHMIKFLGAQTMPVSTDEIFDAVKAQVVNRKKPISIKSIGSYLSNLKCFVSIKKKDINEGTTHHTKPGWILDKEVLKQK